MQGNSKEGTDYKAVILLALKGISKTVRYIYAISVFRKQNSERFRLEQSKRINLRIFLFFGALNATLFWLYYSLFNRSSHYMHKMPITVMLMLIGLPLFVYLSTIGITYFYYRRIYLYTIGCMVKAKLLSIEKIKDRRFGKYTGDFHLKYQYYTESKVPFMGQDRSSDHHIFKTLHHMPKVGDEIDIIYDPVFPADTQYMRRSEFIQFCMDRTRVGQLTKEEEKFVISRNRRAIAFILLGSLLPFIYMAAMLSPLVVKILF